MIERGQIAGTQQGGNSGKVQLMAIPWLFSNQPGLVFSPMAFLAALSDSFSGVSCGCSTMVVHTIIPTDDRSISALIFFLPRCISW